MTEKRLRYVTFALLYLAQGALTAFSTGFLAIYLIEYGLTMSHVGLISGLSTLPFVFKIFLGMISDRWNLGGWGHRKPYIIIGLIGQAVMLLILPTLDPTSFAFFVAMMMVLGTTTALYDCCTDGLAVDTTPPEEEGTVQGIMVAGRALGVVFVAMLIGVLADWSWWAVFGMLALATLIPVPLVLRIEENPESEREPFQWRAFRAFGRIHVIGVLIFGLFMSLVVYGANQLVNPYLREAFGATNTQAGLITATWGVGVILGGIFGGRIADRIGQRKAVVLFSVVAAGSLVPLALAGSLGLAWPLVFVFGLSWGAFGTLFGAMAMAVCQPGIEASMFALMMVGGNIGIIAGVSVAGALVDGLGFSTAFLILAAVNILVVATLPMLPTKGAVAE